MSDLNALLAQLRDLIEQKGMDGVAIPDHERSGRYLVYGSARVLACATTELQLYGHRQMFEHNEPRFYSTPGLTAEEMESWRQDERLLSELANARREKERAMNDCDRPRAEYWAEQIKRCERALDGE